MKDKLTAFKISVLLLVVVSQVFYIKHRVHYYMERAKDIEFDKAAKEIQKRFDERLAANDIPGMDRELALMHSNHLWRWPETNVVFIRPGTKFLVGTNPSIRFSGTPSNGERVEITFTNK